MNTHHTPEPWVTVAHASGRPTVIQSKGRHLAECWSLDRSINCKANAQRIVACVNACAGMEDPAKEIAELRAELARLKNPPSAPTCDELDYDSRS